MTTLPKHLEKMRQYWLGQRSMVHNGIQSHVEFLIERAPIEGFTHVIEKSAVDLMLKDLESMAKALEFADEKLDAWLSQYPKEDYKHGLIEIAEAHDKILEALKNYREKYEVKK